MKKNFKTRITSIIIILCSLHIILNNAFLYKNNYLWIEVRNDVVISAEEQLTINEVLSNIPPILVQNFTIDGYIIYITDSRFHPDYKSVARTGEAYIYYGEDEQYIEIVKSKYLDKMELLFFHEFGHYLDHKEKAWYQNPVVKNYIKYRQSCSGEGKQPLWDVSEFVSIQNSNCSEYYANQFANMLMLKTGTVSKDSFTNKKVHRYICGNLMWMTLKTWLKPNYLNIKKY